MKRYIHALMTDSKDGIVDNIIKSVLWVLSLAYGSIVWLTRFMYQRNIIPSYSSPIPVISVGNITVGGTGKTPLSVWICQVLLEKGYKVVMLSRGYGSRGGENDEVKMVKEIMPQLPIAIGRSRRKSIEKEIQRAPVDVFVADDAFQHWPLQRQLDILAIDASNPFGNRNLLPRGILREDLKALSRADVFVLTKTDRAKNLEILTKELSKINEKAVIIESKHVFKGLRDIYTYKQYDVHDIKPCKVMSLCAIAEPASFKAALHNLGIKVDRHLEFDDHYLYTQQDWDDICDDALKGNMNIIVTTHKDAVKISALQKRSQQIKAVSLDIEIEIIKGKHEFLQRIYSVISC